MFKQIYTMAEEGKRPDLTGSHNWNKESAGETARRQRAEHVQEKAELMHQYRRTDIANHIAALRQQAKTPLNRLDPSITVTERDKLERQNVKYKLKYEQQAGVYSYMKDAHHAQTIGDVEEKLRQHQVKPDVVRLWVEGRMLEHDDLMEQAIVEGYPELDEDIQHMREQQQWRQADNVNDFLAGLDVDEEDL